MKNKLIKMYIDKLKKDDVIFFIQKNNLIVNDKDLDFVYNYVKNLKDLDNIEMHLSSVRKSVTKESAQLIDLLYSQYKNYL